MLIKRQLSGDGFGVVTDSNGSRTPIFSDRMSIERPAASAASFREPDAERQRPI
jgi:hypothetical protein